MSFKELFKKYKIYTIVGIIVLLMLVAGGTTAGVLLTKQDKEQINNIANAAVGSLFTLNSFEYRVLTEGTTNTVEIYDTTSTSISGATEIPGTVANGGITYTVTSICGRAFQNCSRLTSITIPDSVTSIGDYAFQYCSRLTSINIPDSVTSIGSSAFFGCHGLTSITIPSSVTSIGDSAFFGCIGLTSINVDSDNTAYLSRDGVLFNKTQTELIQYPASKSGTSYSIPSSVTSIGDDVFLECSSLTSVTIPNSVTSIGNSAFFGCRSLNNVYFYNDISTNTSSIGGLAFLNNTSTVTYWVKDQTSLTNIQAIYTDSTSKFTANNFQIMTFNISSAVASNSTGMGTVSGGGNGVYLPVTLTAIPNSGYEVAGWTLNSDGSNIISGSEGQTNYTITAAGDETYYVVFQIITYDVMITTDANLGQVFVNGNFTTNTTIEITQGQTLSNLIAVPKQNSAFLYWLVTTSSGTTQLSDNPLSMSITEDTTITAVFSNSLMEGVGVTAIGGGQVRMGGYDGNVDSTTQVVLNAICYSGYTFDGWYTMENGALTKIDALGNFTAVTINVTDYDGKLIIARFIPNSNGNINDDVNN